MLAKKYHPDTNKDNADAAKRFQEVQKAYETLRDPEKRRLYDQVGRENMERMETGGGPEAGPGGMGGFRAGGFQGGFPFGSFGPDIFQQLFEQNPQFAQFFGRGSLSSIRISFMEAVQGTTRRIQLAGLGRNQAGTKLDVNIPAGVDSGDQVEVQVDAPGGRRGQAMRVAIPIEVEPHPYFTREGADVYVKAELPLHAALLGATVQVPTLDGTADLVVPACSQHGDKLRLRGKGIYNMRKGTKGDMYVQLNIIMPKQLTKKQKDLLAQFVEEEEKKASKS